MLSGPLDLSAYTNLKALMEAVHKVPKFKKCIAEWEASCSSKKC